MTEGVVPSLRVERVPAFGQLSIVNDHVKTTFSDDQWAWAELVLEESLALTGIELQRDNWQFGDYGFLAIANLAAQRVASAALPAATATEVPLAGASTPQLQAYDPALLAAANGVASFPVWVELWHWTGTARNANPGLKERREVASVDYVNSKLVLTEDVTKTFASGAALVIPTYGSFAKPRGSSRTEGGLSFFGTGASMFGSPGGEQATRVISAGLALAFRAFGVDTGGLIPETRRAVVNLFMRRDES